MTKERQSELCLYDELYLDDEQSLESDIEDSSIDKDIYGNINIYARDWSVNTFISQIEQGNVDLNPEFQRRNAWNDKKRSRLIESLIYGLPVPEIVLAERNDEKKKFIVIDGKQRLITIAGFCMPDKYQVWGKEKLQGLKNNSELNGKSYSDLANNAEEYKRMLDNALLRCSVIINYKTEDVLFDIFYRLNTGSVPLTTQELRQALITGEFSSFLIQETDKDNTLRDVLRLKTPHKRLIDVEILLRLISFNLFWDEYNGNLKLFLDSSMRKINKDWNIYCDEVNKFTASMYKTIENLKIIFGSYNKIGRKYIQKEKQETRFNRALFECLILCFNGIDENTIINNRSKFIECFSLECINNSNFKSSIDSTTKSIHSYNNRFKTLKTIVRDVFGVENDKFIFEDRNAK